MPFLDRDKLKRLSDDDIESIAILEFDIGALWQDLGGELCACGKLGKCVECAVR